MSGQDFQPAAWTREGDYERCAACGHIRVNHRTSLGKFECRSTRDDASICPCPSFVHSSPTTFYVHWNGAAWFVKTADFFKSQGGHTQEWGKAWVPLVATSIEDARAKAAATLTVKLR